MVKDYLPYIKTFLGESVSLKPIPTLLKPFVRKDASIKAFLFDVYGTLLISASGDIDESVLSTDNLREAFHASDIRFAENGEASAKLLQEILDEFRQISEGIS